VRKSLTRVSISGLLRDFPYESYIVPLHLSSFFLFDLLCCAKFVSSLLSCKLCQYASFYFSNFLEVCLDSVTIFVNLGLTFFFKKNFES
jgi:hypothetical protein